MMCPRCHGAGLVEGRGVWLCRCMVPCLECGGSGRVSCCDEAGAGIAEGGCAAEAAEAAAGVPAGDAGDLPMRERPCGV